MNIALFQYVSNGAASVSSLVESPSWKDYNLTKINHNLALARETETLEKIIPGELQGIFLRKIDHVLEMYCYDTDTNKLSDIMSRIDLTNPLHLIGPYSQAMFLSAFWQEREPERVYIAGFGGGRLGMLFDHYFQNITIDGTDIDPNILTVSAKYFGISENVLKGVTVADSRQDLNSRSQRYDIIFLDVFIGSGKHVDHLATTEFFELCKARLSGKGVVVANLVILDDCMHQKIAAMQAAFKHCYVWECNGAHVVFASDNKADLKQMNEQISKFEEMHTLDFDLQQNLAMLTPSKPNAEVLPLTDKDI